MQPNLEGYEIHEVSLMKREGQSVGISIVGRNTSISEGKETHLPLSAIFLLSFTNAFNFSLSFCRSLSHADGLGIFVKSVVPDSAAEQSGNIRVNDRIIAVSY